MRILHVTFMYPTPQKPFNGVAVEALVNGIGKSFQGAEQTVLHLTNIIQGDIIGESQPSCTYYRLHLPRLYKIIHFYAGLKAIEVLKDKVFDIVHFHNFFPGVFLLEDFIMERKLPYIITFRGSCLRAIKFIYRRRKMKELISGASQYIFPSEFFANKIAVELSRSTYALDKKKINLIPNFKDNKWTEGVSLSFVSSPFKLLLIANIEERKNIGNTIAGVRKVMDKYPVTLDIYGEVYDDELIKRENLELDENIKFHSSVPNKELRKIIDEHHAVILLAHKETFGIAYIESIIRQRPVIYSLSAGIASYIRNEKYGVGVNDENNIDEISAAIIKCIDNYNNFDFTGNGKFLESEVMKIWTEVYRKALPL